MALTMNLVIAFVTFILCLATMWQFVFCLSSHDHSHFHETSHRSEVGNIFLNLLVDVGLLLIFAAQHSIMAKKKVKQMLAHLHSELEVLLRTIYTISTCIVLQLMMTFWKPIGNATLWEVDTSTNANWWWIFTCVHWLLWFVIYGGALVMDVGELVGIKQVYYHAAGLPDPLRSKSGDLQRLYRHVRHPSLTALAAILWFHPVMRLDRTLLAAALVGYMTFAFTVDDRDHAYHRHQLRRKEVELKHL